MPSPGASSLSAGSLLSGTDWTDPSKASQAAGQAAGQLFKQGETTFGQGQFALGPVIQRLMQLLSGNPALVDQAIEPQARGVSDAYTAARRNIAQFTPRGGGQASTITESRFKEAGEIGSLRASAVSGAADKLANIGGSLLSAGANLESASVSDLVGLVRSAIEQQGSNRAFWGQLGAGIGKLALGIGLGVATGGASAPVSAGLIGSGFDDIAA